MNGEDKVLSVRRIAEIAKDGNLRRGEAIVLVEGLLLILGLKNQSEYQELIDEDSLCPFETTNRNYSEFLSMSHSDNKIKDDCLELGFLYALFEQQPVEWINNCDKSAVSALRDLASGSTHLNSDELLSIANDIESMANVKFYTSMPIDETLCLSMQIRRLLYSLKCAKPDSKLVKSISEYMFRKGHFKTTDCLRS